jgi:hypothetical protein
MNARQHALRSLADDRPILAAMAKRIPHRIQLRRTGGWRMPHGALKVDRTTRWGNPFRLGIDGDRAQCVALYRHWLVRGNAAVQGVRGDTRDELLRDLPQLRGHDLACWCPPDQPCHAEVLLELANR